MIIGSGGRLPPADLLYIAGDSAGPAISGADFYESLESTYVRITNRWSSGPANDFGEFWVVAERGSGAAPG